MNVLNRNMFRNRDSRNRLAQMGGILSSSPELQETAMTFANGGGANLDTKFILTNIPELGIREGQFVKISAKTLEGLNNAIPEVMARHGDKVKSVQLMMDERNSALVALAREGDALIGTRVNRLLEQRATDSAAASDVAPVSIPSDMSQISSAADVFAISRAPSTEANIARDNRVARSIAAASNEDLTSPAQLRADPPQANDAAVLAAQKRRFEDAAAAAANSARLMAERGMLNNPLESGIAKAIPTDTDKLLEVASSILSDEQKEAIASGKISDRAEALLKVSPAEELIKVSGPLPEAFTGTETENRAADAANATAVLTGTAKPKDGESSVLSSAGEAIKSLLPEELGFQRRQRERRERANLAALDASDQSRVLDPVEQELFSEAPVAGTGKAGLAQKIRDGSLTPEELKAALDSGAGDLTLEAAERIDPEITGAVSFDPKIVPSALLGEEGKARRLKNIQDRLDKRTKGTLDEIEEVLGPDYSGQVESGTSKEGSTRPPSFRRNADGVFIIDNTPQGPRPFTSEIIESKDTSPETLAAITESLQENQSAADAEMGVPAPPSKKVIKSLKTTAEQAGSAGVVGDGSIADLTKGYVKLLKDLLGESDEDKAARKGELFMLMGAALMSGKSSNALTNVGNALQIGAKAAIQDRVTRKKRDDTIGLKGFEMAADRIAKRDAQQLALDKEVRDRQTQLDLIDARLGASKDLASYRAELDALKYTNMGEHKGLNSIFDLAEKGYADVAFDKPKDITLLELFELEARKAKYTQEQINRFNRYYGREGSGATGGAEGGGQSLDDIT